MRILHTSDWHLGRQFHGISLLAEQRYVLEQVLAALTEQAVDVLIIAGDIYDRAIPPTDAINVFDEFLTQVKALDIPVLLISGNHDSRVRLGFGAEHFARSGIYIGASVQAALSPVVLSDTDGEVAFYLLPYAEPNEVRAAYSVEVASHAEAMQFLCDRVRATEREHATRHAGAQRRVVAVAHCFVDGGAVSESERPLSVGGLETVAPASFDGFNYVALGHLHSPQYRQRPELRYSGSLLKYSFSEVRQSKSLSLVDLSADGSCVIDSIPLRPRRDMRVIEGDLASLLAAGKVDPHADDYLLVRLNDRHAILDVMNKLRGVYPNALHLERPGLLTEGALTSPAKEQLARGPAALFSDFYQQMTEQTLTDEQQALVQDALQTLLDQERAE